MNRATKPALVAAGALATLSLTTLAPAAQADEGFYSRNGADRSVAGVGNGNHFSTPSSTALGDAFDVSDAALGALAGLAAAGAAVVALGAARRHQRHAPHPA